MTIALLMLTGLALAQDDPDAPRRRGGGNGEGPRAGNRRGDGQGGGRMRGQGQRGQGRQGRQGRQRPGQRLQQVLGQLKLTDVQRAKIDEIIAEQNAPMQAATAAMREARQSGDDEAIQAARQAMAELREQRGQGPDKKLIRRIAAVLTKTQRQQFLELMGPAGEFAQLLEAVKTLELTPAQSRQIRQIAAQAASEARMKTEDKEKAKVYADAQKKVMDLLTDEQKAQLRRRMAPRGGGQRGGMGPEMFDQLGLSPEQQEAMESVQAEIREQMQQAEGREARREVMRSARQRMNEILTDEQQEQFREMRQQRFQGGRGGGGQRGGDGGGNGRRGGRGGNGPNAGDGANNAE